MDQQLSVSCSPGFPAWLKEQRVSLAFTTYQTGKLFFLGLRPEGGLSVFERTFERCMGLCVSLDARTLWMSSAYQLWRFENALGAGHLADGYDALYVPQVAYTTGDVDAHDITLDSAGRPIFVATLLSCLAAVSETHSLRPIWRPPFISAYAAEDRCHLNGLAMRDGTPAFVSAVSETDTHEGWREHRRDGGVIIEVASGETVCRGLSMPHSPRWHAETNTLYALNSGAADFGRVDLASGRFEPMTFCPGFARGMALHGNFAVVALSNCRENRSFPGMPIDEKLKERQVTMRCGLMVIDLSSGQVAHFVILSGIVQELYDVAILPGVVRASAIGLLTDEIRKNVTLDV